MTETTYAKALCLKAKIEKTKEILQSLADNANEDWGVCTYSQYCDPKGMFVLDSETSCMLVDHYKTRLDKLEKEFDEL
jgi:hypothetical protein